ncbi:MAG: flagellar basal body P-ring protein FlgI [Verrucomicrobia bacterium]|nr:flagellar basal body P-ring protein FlgI [Verrucomicrobiota bacterium]
MRSTFSLAILLLALAASHLNAARVKDIARIQGTRQNQLIGYGMVVGLGNTGDSNPNITLQTVANFVNRFGLTVTTTDIKANNAALVVVTADLPAFIRTGSRIDVNVASMADAKSLQGGVLSQTPLIGADGQVYAVAQGAVSIAGFGAGNTGAGSASIQKNHLTTAQIPDGALVEREVPSELVTQMNTLDVALREPDFTSAQRMAEAFNRRFPSMAMAVDSGTVRLQVPPDSVDPAQHVHFISQVENVETEPDVVTRVVVNERTGTIVANARIHISNVAVAHGNLIVSVVTTQGVSQPLPFSTTGTTQVTQGTTTDVKEQRASLVKLGELPTVDQVATALNALGATPRDMIAIFEALKQAGALQAELVIR